MAELCSQLFYERRLESGISAEEVTFTAFPFSQERSSALGPGVAPLAVVLSEGLETRVGQSYRHDAEAKREGKGFSDAILMLFLSLGLKRPTSCRF